MSGSAACGEMDRLDPAGPGAYPSGERTTVDPPRPVVGPERIAFVVTTMGVGGMERVVLHLATELHRRGLCPMIFCLSRKGTMASAAEQQGVPVMTFGSSRGYDARATMAFARELRRFRPEVINVHDRTSLPYVVIANRLAGRRPIVLSCHGLLLQDRQSRRLRDRLSVREVQAVTAVSQQSAREYAEMLGLDREVYVLPNGVPAMEATGQLHRAVKGELGLLPEAIVFLAVGDAKPEKGFEDLLLAADGLRQAGCGRPFVVLIAGKMDNGPYCQHLRAEHLRLELGNTVRFLGRRADMEALYSASDIFVLSSRTEGLPMVLLESMSAGLPAIGTRVGAVPDVLSGDRGVLVAPASPAGLTEAMQRLLQDEPLRRRLGKAGREFVASQHGVARMTDEYVKVYDRVRAGSHQHPRCAVRPGIPRRRPRVLMLGPLPPLTGGMATVVSNLSRSSLTQTCRLVTMNNGKMTPEGRSLVSGVWSQLALFARVVGAVARHRVEVVHIHTCAMFSFWRDIFHMAAFRMLGAKVVWHIHDGSFVPFLAGQPPFLKSILRHALKAASAAIVLSKSAADSVRPLAPDVRWRVVPNGVPMPPQLAPMSNGEARFLFIGNLTRRKGAYDLVDAFALAAKQAGFAAKARLAGGETAPGQKDALLAHIGRSGCAEGVELLGLVFGREKDNALVRADCVVLPSYAEGLPMVVLEGMSYGLPIIASDVGAIREVITDGKEGFILDPGDVSGLADRMARLARDRELRHRMGRLARQRVETCYSLEVAARTVLGIYREVLHSSADNNA